MKALLYSNLLRFPVPCTPAGADNGLTPPPPQSQPISIPCSASYMGQDATNARSKDQDARGDSLNKSIMCYITEHNVFISGETGRMVHDIRPL